MRGAKCPHCRQYPDGMFVEFEKPGRWWCKPCDYTWPTDPEEAAAERARLRELSEQMADWHNHRVTEGLAVDVERVNLMEVKAMCSHCGNGRFYQMPNTKWFCYLCERERDPEFYEPEMKPGYPGWERLVERMAVSKREAVKRNAEHVTESAR